MKVLRCVTVLFSLPAFVAIGHRGAGAAETSPAAMVSQYRAAHGMSRVTADAALTRAAKAQADAMARASTMSHSIGGEFQSRIRQTGVRYASAAENIGEGYRSLAHVMEGWIGSAGHRENLLLAGATRIGFASARDGRGQSYWALIIAAPMQRPLAGGPYARSAKPAARTRPAAAQSSSLSFPFNLFSGR